MAKRTAWVFVALLLLASAFFVGALAMPESMEIAVGERTEISADGRTIKCTPPSNSPYAVCFFSDSPVSAVLYDGEETVAQGTGTGRLFSVVLNGGTQYTLYLSGSGRGTLEIMRDTLGRSYTQPIEMSSQGDNSYEKLLVSPGDVHWYAFTAYLDGPATVYAAPYETDSALRISGILTDADGNVLAGAQPGENDGFALYARLHKGRRYLVRVSGEDGTTGAYRLTVEQDGKNRISVDEVAVTPEILTLEIGQSYALRARLTPADAHPVVIWSSSDEQVATVSDAGQVTAVGAGRAIVTAKAYGGVSDACVVEVESVPLSGIGFSEGEMELRAGESARLEMDFYPENATNRKVKYFSLDPAVAETRPDGTVQGIQEGTTAILAVSEDGSYTDRLELTVTQAAPKYRALLVGQQMYRPDVNKVRVGSINTTQSMAEMLGTQSMDGERYATRVLLDSTRNETLAAIRETFRDAVENDVSLFYITCHGDYENGMSYLQFYDGSILAARDLELELRRIPGTVVVIVDCCGSGGLIGRASSLEDFNRGVVSVFSGATGAGEMALGKYKVLASAALDQESYRISFDENATEGDMATVFARAICDGAGYSIDRAQRAAVRADLNYDQKITLQEIYLYASRRVMWYLNLAEELSDTQNVYVQTVQVYPQGDTFELFGR